MLVYQRVKPMGFRLRFSHQNQSIGFRVPRGEHLVLHWDFPPASLLKSSIQVTQSPASPLEDRRPGNGSVKEISTIFKDVEGCLTMV